MTSFIPIARVTITDEDIAEVTAVLRSGWITTGPKTREFEQRAREYLGARHALAVSSGTAALHLALSALGLGPGDEVITTPLTFAATANAAIFVGATPVLADVDPATLNLDPARVEAALTERTRAILVVHYAGLPVDLDAFRALSRAHRLALVEDACHAIGAEYRGKRIGAESRAALYSFHPVKNMTTGEGGLLVTDDDEVERLARLRSWHGIDKNALRRHEQGGNWYYEVQDLGWKYNATDIASALGLVQLRRLDVANRQRREIAARYDAAFAGLEGVRVAPSPSESLHARHLYWMVLDPERYDRDRFITSLTRRNVGANVHYIPIHLHPYYRRRFGWREGLCPVAEAAYRGLVSIPLFHGMSDEERDRVIDAVIAGTREARR
jgi:dTDP-4-amino-4,6-dideoxygalactose transaminase